jgi:hypothetical protein
MLHLCNGIDRDEGGVVGGEIGEVAVDRDERASVVLDVDIPWVPREHGEVGSEVGEAAVHPTSLSSGGLVEEAQAAEPLPR